MQHWFSIALIALVVSGCVTTNKSSGQSGSLRLQDINFTFPSILPSKIKVKSSGSGSTELEAIDNALIEATKQAMGVLIVSELSSKQDKIVSDFASSYASGVVTEYKKIECLYQSRVICKIQATVSPWAIRNKIFASISNTPIKGNNLYAQYRSKQHVAHQRRKLINYYLDALYDRGLVAEMSSVEIVGNAQPQLRLAYSVEWDSDFRTEFLGFLRQLERDTGEGGLKGVAVGVISGFFGVTSNGLDPCWGGTSCEDIKVEWGLGIETALYSQSVYLKLNDKSLANLIRNKLKKDISFGISPFGICDTFDGSENGKWGSLPDTYITREITFPISPIKLKSTNNITIKAGC